MVWRRRPLVLYTHSELTLGSLVKCWKPAFVAEKTAESSFFQLTSSCMTFRSIYSEPFKTSTSCFATRKNQVLFPELWEVAPRILEVSVLSPSWPGGPFFEDDEFADKLGGIFYLMPFERKAPLSFETAIFLMVFRGQFSRSHRSKSHGFAKLASWKKSSDKSTKLQGS